MLAIDTIYAPASARGKAGVCVIRISGPSAWDAVGRMSSPLPEPRKAVLRSLRGADGILDQALVVLFEHGRSFTGEAVAELHLHGSIATVNAVLRELAGHAGLRLADAGEFTRRALENGCLDLAQVEGLSDLIDAETEAQRKQALRVLSGAIGEKAAGWRVALIRAAALIEATIDFADEEVPVDVEPEVTMLLEHVGNELAREIAGIGAAERIRDGFEVAIVGHPNSGKSTLINWLAGREAAITSEHAGTTRDVIEVRMDIAGLPVTFLDTAGLRPTSDAVEAIGVERALSRAREADLRVFLADPDVPLELTPLAEDIVMRAKADLFPEAGGISGKMGAGVPELIAKISDRLVAKAASAATITRERHRIAIMRAVEAMELARDEIKGHKRPELAADQLHRAIHALDALVGRVDVEDVLGEIFARFCIGK